MSAETAANCAMHAQSKPELPERLEIKELDIKKCSGRLKSATLSTRNTTYRHA